MDFVATAELQTISSSQQYFRIKIAKGSMMSVNSHIIATQVTIPTQLSVATLIVDKVQVTVTYREY